MRVVLVAGPPCAGKTTYVREHIRSGDLVLDRDRLEEALTETPGVLDEAIGQFVASAFYAVLKKNRVRSLLTFGDADRTLWVQECAPRRETRRRYLQMNGPTTEVVVLDTPKEVCEVRARERFGVDDERLEVYMDAIRLWWVEYERGM